MIAQLYCSDFITSAFKNTRLIPAGKCRMPKEPNKNKNRVIGVADNSASIFNDPKFSDNWPWVRPGSVLDVPDDDYPITSPTLAAG